MARLAFETSSYTDISPLDSEIIRPNHDLNAHMMGRKDKLNFLIKFINDNAALSKVLGIRIDRMRPMAEAFTDVPVESSAALYGRGETTCRSSSLVEA